MASVSKNDPTKPILIALNLIEVDYALQPRVEMDVDHADAIAEAYQAKVVIPPPIDVFRIDGRFRLLLADGFHRYKGMWSIRHLAPEYDHVLAFVHDGTMSDAVEFAARANLKNMGKPLGKRDRKKAFMMLMGLPEWQRSTAISIGRILNLSPTAAKKYWIEYFVSQGLPLPAESLTKRGVSVCNFTNLRDDHIPKIRSKGDGKYEASVNGNRVNLGGDIAVAKSKLESILERDRESKSAQFKGYSSSGNVSQYLAFRGILTHKIFPSTISYPGFFGLKVNGVAVCWDKFESFDCIPRIYGVALKCRKLTGFQRIIVLCPDVRIKRQSLNVFAEDNIELMTIEEFVGSMKAEGEPTPGAPTTEQP